MNRNENKNKQIKTNLDNLYLQTSKKIDILSCLHFDLISVPVNSENRYKNWAF
jgi:hypothetical protein